MHLVMAQRELMAQFVWRCDFRASLLIGAAPAVNDMLGDSDSRARAVYQVVGGLHGPCAARSFSTSPGAVQGAKQRCRVPSGKRAAISGRGHALQIQRAAGSSFVAVRRCVAEAWRVHGPDRRPCFKTKPWTAPSTVHDR